LNLTFKENYYQDEILKKELNRFLKQIHNLDLVLWNEAGYWDKKYRPFSFFDGDKMVASACLYSMDMMVDGIKTKVAQISGVGTDPEYRRKGLSFELNMKAIEWARDNHDFYYLFADLEAYPLYKKCGFRLVDEYSYHYPVEGCSPKPGIQKLDIKNRDHLNLIYKMAIEREPVSDLFGVFNEKLFMFWCLYFLQDNIYYIKELDLLVLYERVKNHIKIFDIVSDKILPFSKIYPYITNKNDKVAEFLFMIDKMNLEGGEYKKLEPGNGAHMMGFFPLDNQKFILPFTCHA